MGLRRAHLASASHLPGPPRDTYRQAPVEISDSRQGPAQGMGPAARLASSTRMLASTPPIASASAARGPHRTGHFGRAPHSAPLCRDVQLAAYAGCGIPGLALGQGPAGGCSRDSSTLRWS